MRCALAALLFLAILPLPSATAKPHGQNANVKKINYKKVYVTKPYNKHKKQPTVKYGQVK